MKFKIYIIATKPWVIYTWILHCMSSTPPVGDSLCISVLTSLFAVFWLRRWFGIFSATTVAENVCCVYSNNNDKSFRLKQPRGKKKFITEEETPIYPSGEAWIKQCSSKTKWVNLRNSHSPIAVIIARSSHTLSQQLNATSSGLFSAEIVESHSGKWWVEIDMAGWEKVGEGSNLRKRYISTLHQKISVWKHWGSQIDEI